MLDMINAGRSVYVVAMPGQPRQRLESMGILQRLPKRNVVEDRLAALEHSVHGERPSVPAAAMPTDDIHSAG
jgi:hypothetical protein